MRFILIISLFLGVGCLPSWAQEENLQTIRGTVLDNATKDPLKDVLIEILNFSPPKSSKTDERGRFVLQDVPTGRYRLSLSHPKYNRIVIPELEVIAGEQAFIKINMEKTPVQNNLASSMNIKPPKDQVSPKYLPNNHLALVGIRPISVDEVKRYPVTLEDPSRVVSRFAGVNRVPTETGLLVRGHPVHTMLWRIEGLPVVSPNHVAFTEGASGFLPIFNMSLLRNSDFLNGAYPAEYGNAIGGIFDLGLRSGNRFGYQGSFRLDITGVEGIFEGPLGKSEHSFIVGGRYNYMPLFRSAFGPLLRTVPSTQDVSFKFHFKGREFETNVFGIGGLSRLQIDVSQLDSNAVAARTFGDFDRKKTYGLFGINHKHLLLSRKGYFFFTLGTNYNGELLHEYDALTSYRRYHSQTTMSTFMGYLHYEANDFNQIRTGVTVSHYFLDFEAKQQDAGRVLRAFRGHTMLAQVHVQWLLKIGKKLKLNFGVNGQYLLLNNSYGISPRFALAWQLAERHQISLGYSWGHQLQPWEAYFNRSQQASTFGELPDRDLGFTENHHFSLAYGWDIVDNWRLNVEGYYQRLYNIPVNDFVPAIALVNQMPTQNLLETSHFSNEGKGFHYGVELMLEKFFHQGYYGLLSLTYFDAKYLSTDGIWRNTASNLQYMGHLVVGKSFNIGPKRKNRFFVDMSYSYTPGYFYTPIDLGASRAADRQLLDWSQAYQGRHKGLHNVDFRLGLLINQKKKLISHKIFIEFTNLLHQRPVYRTAYNPQTEQIVAHRFVGIIPNLSYRINFGFKSAKEQFVK